MTIRQVIEGFYAGLANKTAEWQRNLSEEVVFSDASGKLHAEGKDAFIQSFSSFLRGVERVQMKQLLAEADRAAAIVSYDYVNSKRERLHQDDAEVWKVVDGKIEALTIYFDITEFRSFMSR